MEEKINLQTGSLSLKELESILDSIPVDLSFVDDTDTVKYFNRMGKRIFPRNKSVIGKKVQDCHPKESIGKVNEILEGFKKGSLEYAEFWINLKGTMIYIRYFPLRNREGNYLGCLEVSQDVTRIRKIEGEKRLL